MEAPPEDIRRAANGEEKPNFDSWESPEELVSGSRTRDDFLDVALQLREPTPISEIADRADRGEDSAREYMQFFENMGIVRKFTGRPTRYRVNRNYLRWRRVDQLRNEYTQDELIDHLTKMNDVIEEYQDQFQADIPANVSLTRHADRTGRSTEAVWEDIGDWKTVEVRRALVEAALQSHDSLFDIDERLIA